MFKKVVVLAAVTVLFTMAFSTLASAQFNDVYWVNYFSQRNNGLGFDQFLRIINTGQVGSPTSPAGPGLVPPQGTLCANIYVFNNDQEMEECCACPITANGLLQLSINNSLTANPLTSPAPNSGVIKIVSSFPQPQSNTHAGVVNFICDPTGTLVALYTPNPDLRSWATHLTQYSAGLYQTTEDASLPAPLQAAEQAYLNEACQFVLYLGTGKGSCLASGVCANVP